MEFKHLKVGQTYKSKVKVHDSDEDGGNELEFIFLGNDDSNMFVLLKDEIDYLNRYERVLSKVIDFLNRGNDASTQAFSEFLVILDGAFYDAFTSWEIIPDLETGIQLRTCVGYKISGLNTDYRVITI